MDDNAIMNPASAADNDAAPEPPTGAIRTQQSRSKKPSGTTIAKRACDQCKFRKIKVNSPFYLGEGRFMLIFSGILTVQPIAAMPGMCLHGL